jgi:hypothetical protein
MHKLLKRILPLIHQNKIRLPYEKYKEYYDLMKDIVDTFFDLYLLHTDVDNSDWNKLFREIKNLNNLYSRIVLGRYNIFLPKKKHLDKISEKIIEIKSILTSLERDIEQLPS